MSEEHVSPGPVSYRWLVFGLLAAGYLLVYFHRNSTAVVALDLMKDLSADSRQIGALGAAYFYPYALMQLPAGLLSDSWGPRRTITAFFILAGAASLFFGFSPSINMAIFARVLVGLGVAMLFVPTMKVLTQWFRRTEFATMTGILMAIGGAGVLFAAQPLAWMSNLLGWRGSFQAIGVITLILAAAIWVLVRNRPQDKGFPPVESAEDAAGGAVGEKIGLGPGMKMVLTKAAFWPVAIWFFFTLGIFFSFGGLWGGPWLQQIHGLTKPEAGSVLNMLAVAMIIFSPLLSWISNRVRSRKYMLVACSILMLVLTAVLAFANDSISRPMLYPFFFLVSVGSSAIVVIGFTMAKELFPVSIAGTSVGLMNFFPFFGGAVFMQVLGWRIKQLSPTTDVYNAEIYGQTYVILFGAAIIAFVAALLAKDTYPRR